MVRLGLTLLPAAQHVLRAELELVVCDGRPLVHVDLLNLVQNSEEVQSESFTSARRDKMEYDLVCRASQQQGHITDHVLHHQEALGHAEAPEGGVGGQVGPAGGAAAPQVGDVVVVVHMKKELLYNLREEQNRCFTPELPPEEQPVSDELLLQTRVDSSTVFPALA